MTLGERIELRRIEIGISQAELARRVGIRQSTINSLIHGNSRTTRSLFKIAQELQTSPEYLMGETDDPDEGAPVPPPAPTYNFITMQVALPSEAALTRMFQALLRLVPEGASEAERARILARRLPTGLAQLQDLMPESAGDAVIVPDAAAPAPATDRRELPPKPSK